VSDRGLPIADGAPACPFVAFDDDRDERATVPDHRHRCYADTRPSPRALAHQEAYCLSSAFPVCPTFQDWARRESARARADAQAREDADAADRRDAVTGSIAAAGAAGAGQGADWRATDDGASDAAAAASDGDPATDDGAHPVSGADDDDEQDDDEQEDREPYDDEGPRRNPPREWSAPPPWLASSEAARGAHNAPPPDFLARRASEPGQGLVGSAADQLAGGPPPPPVPRSDARPRFEAQMPGVQEIDHSDTPPPRRPRAYDQHLGGPSSGPDWERPRRYEAYPTIKTRVGMPAIPRIAFLGLLIVLGTLAFFFLPAFLGLGGNTGAPPASILLSPSPSESLEPTPVPVATPILYTIKKGETLSKIATAHGITLEQLLAANKTIKNPNKITEGQQITIPVPEGDVPVDASPSESGAASP
jgi:LysM repeat protein